MRELDEVWQIIDFVTKKSSDVIVFRTDILMRRKKAKFWLPKVPKKTKQKKRKGERVPTGRRS